MRAMRRLLHPSQLIPGRHRGVLLNFDPNRITGVADGGAVATVSDFSGNGYNATQGTGTKQAAWTRNGRNGRAVLTFDGGDEYFLSGNGLNLFRNANARTIVLVMQATAPGSDATPLFATTAASGSGRLVYQRESGGAGTLRIGGRRLDADAATQFATGGAGTVVAGAWTIDTAVFDWASSDLYLYQNGAQIASNTSFQTAGATSDTASAVIVIGSQNGGAYINGQIARVLVYDHVPTAHVLTRLHRTLGRREYAIGVA